MTNYQRLTAKVFGETATATGDEPEIGQFGSALAGTYIGTTDVATIQNLTAWSNGFIDCVTPDNQFPPLPEMTGFGKVLSYHEAYLLQKGIPEWDSATTYYQDDFCRVGHTVYYSLQDGNINHNPTTDTAYWKDFTIGANRELSNLEDAGEDRLHALKGYLESGQKYTDATLYNDVAYYNHSTFDVSKFTKVGSPIITDNGVVLTADSSNYAQLNFDFSQDHTFEIEIKGNNSTATTIRPFNYGYQIYINPNNSNRCLIYVNSGASYQIASITDEALKSNYTLKIRIKKVSLTYTIDYIINGTITGTLTTTLATTPTYETYIRFQGSLDAQHSVDLKTLKISNANGIPIFSGNKTGIDTIKSDNYTVVGSPTISADGVATSLNSSNYITLPNLTVGNNWELTYKVIWNTATRSNSSMILQMKDGTVTFQILNQTSKAITSSIYGMFGSTKYINYISDSEVSQFTDGDVVIINLKANNNTLYYTVYKNGSVFKTNHIDSITNNIGTLTEFSIGQYSNASTTMQIDLNAIKVYKDGNLIYQPCLLIPYTESSTGSKIVDVAYRDRVIDVYNQYGSANYYTIDEINENCTLPMGELYGINSRTDFSNVIQQGKSTSISWGLPDWTRAINFNSSVYYSNIYIHCRGWIRAIGYSNDKAVGIRINTNYVVAQVTARGSSDSSSFACLVPVDDGDKVTGFSTNTPSSTEYIDVLSFIPCKGEPLVIPTTH